MHKFKVEIQIDNKNNCKGCPLLRLHRGANPLFNHYLCGLGFYDLLAVERQFEKQGFPKRPKRCREENDDEEKR